VWKERQISTAESAEDAEKFRAAELRAVVILSFSLFLIPLFLGALGVLSGEEIC
jgi:hypothetical protein